jgi:hypothetical protein
MDLLTGSVQPVAEAAQHHARQKHVQGRRPRQSTSASRNSAADTTSLSTARRDRVRIPWRGTSDVSRNDTAPIEVNRG